MSSNGRDGQPSPVDSLIDFEINLHDERDLPALDRGQPVDNLIDFDMDMEDLPAVDREAANMAAINPRQVADQAMGRVPPAAPGAAVRAEQVADQAIGRVPPAAPGAAVGAENAGRPQVVARGNGAQQAVYGLQVVGAGQAGDQNLPPWHQRAGRRWQTRARQQQNLVNLLYKMANTYRGGGRGGRKKRDRDGHQ